MAHFLVCTKPAPGHVNPLRPLVRELVERGHAVDWYTGSSFVHSVEAAGARHRPVRSAPDFFGATTVSEYRSEIDPKGNELRGLSAAKFELKHVCYDVAALEFEDLGVVLRERTPDVVIADPTVLGAFYLCERYRIPCAVVGITVLPFRSRDTAPVPLGLRPRSGRLGLLRNRGLDWIMNTLVMRDVERHGDHVRAGLGLGPAGVGFFDVAVATCDLWLQPTTPDFEYPRSDLADRVHFIGPLLPPPAVRFDAPDWWADVEGDRPVVLVTQGTVRSDPRELVVPALTALADEDLLVVATIGDNDIGVDIPDNARVAAFIPYDRLLPHVDVMITNAGYGGVHFALAHGVPLVAAGRTEEKPEICARVAWSGAGIRLRAHPPRPRHLRSAVDRVLADPRFRRRSRSIGERFGDYDAARTGATLLEDLAS
jgi:UDP:flavonoid glycosyltransferase YjiC (YdhE family)